MRYRSDPGIFGQLRTRLIEELAALGDPDDESVRTAIRKLLSVDRTLPPLSVSARKTLEQQLFKSIRRLDILQELLDDPSVTEIMVNGPDNIFFERGGVLQRWEKTFSGPEKLEDVIRQIAGRCNRVINESSPIVDARLPDGSRVNAVIAPAALNGPLLTIRRFPDVPITVRQLIRLNSLTEEAAHFLKNAVAAGYSILISGGTSAGKTTFLNALSRFIPSSERIITIEDNAELQIQGIANLVRLEAKNANMTGDTEVTIRDLIRSALRMRPDRIIVGEVRGAEAVDMLQAMNTGHDGSMSTLHANSASDALSRLETMVLTGFPLPLPAIRRQIVSGVDLIVHLGRLPDHTRHVLEISEMNREEEKMPLHPIFRWDYERDRLVRCGELLRTEKLRRAGIRPSGSKNGAAAGKKQTSGANSNEN